MTMEKTGDIKPGRTPDIEDRLEKPVEKQADADKQEQTRQLDDDVTKRLADAASG